MRRLGLRFRREEHGQSLLEFALIVPVLFIIICGIIDFGMLLYYYLQMNLAVQEAVRIGGLGGTDAEIIAYLQSHTYNHAEPPTITVSPGPTYRESGDYLTVHVEQTVSFLTPVVSAIVPDASVTAASTIRIE